MKYCILLLSLTFLLGCKPEVKKEYQKLVKSIDYKVKSIDHHHRIQIVEDDFVVGDSTYKIRAYMSEGQLQKLVGILRTPHYERDDYFYFENKNPIFSGHMINFMDDRLAEEFKYYYRDNKIVESLFWKDYYDPNKRFPHEEFEEFEPDMDSLMKEESDRLNFFLAKINEEGFEIKHENTNLNN